MLERNTVMPSDKRIEFRIGINVGDVVVEDGDIFGDGVNVAARLEALADPGGICVSARVQEDAAGRLDLAFEDMGEQALKNIARSVRVYRVRLAVKESRPKAAPTESAPTLALPDKPSIAVLPFSNMSGDPETGIFRRWHGRRDRYSTVPNPMVIRHRTQFELFVQGPISRREAGRTRAWRPLCARRLGSEGKGPDTNHCTVGRCFDWNASLG